MTRFPIILVSASLLPIAGCTLAPQRTSTTASSVHSVATPVNESKVVTLRGNVSPLANAENEVGVAPAETQLNHMVLLLKPSAAQQSALDALTAAQQDPRSPLYHHWLTPAEYGARFGASDTALEQVTGWLQSQGFTVNQIASNRRLLVFSGDAGQVADTFHTEMRTYRVAGAMQIANAQDPQIPAELATSIAGIVSLNGFRHVAQSNIRSMIRASAQSQQTNSHPLMPQDFAAIYDANAVYNSGIKGAGVTIAVAGRSNINVSDVAAFRTAAGLAANNPTVILNGSDPGLVDQDQGESTLDVEWAGAVAPEAKIKLVASASTAVSDGIDSSVSYIVNHNLAPIVSVSYSSCEQGMTAAELAFYNSLWQQAASQGMSVFVSSGDSGAAGCDAASASTGSGVGVNGMCSSPYATCVGGTEFNEGTNATQYWKAAAGSTQTDAVGYIPETAWNESAADGGNALWATGGGPSRIYTQPAWQQGVSGTADANGMRAVPDVSLTSAAHDGYTICLNGSMWVASGTSVATPSFAALMAMVVQSQNGADQGNANPGLYGLLNGLESPFHVTPTGNNSVPGVAGFTASGTEYNLATGLGSVDAKLLVNDWRPSSASQTPVRARGGPSLPSGPGAR